MRLLQRLVTWAIGSLICLVSIPHHIHAHGGDTSLVHACVHNNGGVRIVGPSDNCNTPEIARHWSIAGPIGPQGPQGPQGIQGPPGTSAGPSLGVYDANGSFLGSIVGIDSVGSGGPDRPFIAMRIGDVAFVVKVFIDRFGGNQPNVMFESANCSGSAFLPRTDRPIPAVIAVGDIVYVADTFIPLANVAIGSLLNADGSCILGGGIDQLHPALRLDVGALFTPPFTIR
jgi:hypothetical protein